MAQLADDKSPRTSDPPEHELMAIDQEQAGSPTPHRSWKYRSLNVGRFRIPWYASPPVQLALVASTCFLCPGMFNALAGMGGGGNINHKAADDANCALYSFFAVCGFIAGSITNKIGVKTALSFGGLGYCVYIASFLCYKHTENLGFTVFAGALLGVCAGLLWTAEGVIMLSYPPEHQKGRYIAIFWSIFNTGAVIGSLIPLAQNIHVQEKRTVTDGTYVAFIVLTALGAVLAWTLVDARSVIRADGSKVILMKNPTWQSEVFGLVETFASDPYIVLLFPMFFASNWFYTYQFNDVNGLKFNTRTAALNNTLYWLAQIVGSFTFGYALDRQSIRRSVRAKICWAVLFSITMGIWGGGYVFQKSYTRADVNKTTIYDWTTEGYAGPLILYICYGFYDAVWQTTVYWFMGALTNNGRKLANFAGFYKGIQSAGAAVVWRLDTLNTPLMSLFASCWVLLAGSLVVALPVILLKIKDTVPIEEDIKFSDERVEDVEPKAGKVFDEPSYL